MTDENPYARPTPSDDAPLSHDAPVEVYPSALALGYTSTGKAGRLWSRVRWWLAG